MTFQNRNDVLDQHQSQLPQNYANRKTIRLGAPKDIRGKKNKPKRKKWAIGKAFEILSERKEKAVLKFLRGQKKLDDYCDTICMMQAFKMDVFVSKKL